MRVIGGMAGGVRLARVPAGTRPLSDRAREGLFSSLGRAVEGARVLDLYAGTGATGIEALSRGARGATFVDRSAPAIRTIHANLDKTGLGDRATVVRSDVLRFLERAGEPADLCFLDPPYAAPSREVEGVVDVLARGCLAPGGLAALTRPKRGYTPVIPLNWQVLRRLEYGDTLIILYREVESERGRPMSGDIRPRDKRPS